MQCPACGFQFEGLAVACPRCEAPLPRPRAAVPAGGPGIVSPLPTVSAVDRRGAGEIALMIVLGVIAAVLVFAAFLWLAFVLYFCLDLNLGEDTTNDCADEEASAARLVFMGGIPAALLAGGLTAYGIGRLGRRRRTRRRAPAASPPERPTVRRG